MSSRSVMDNDHVSILKFIEANRRLSPLTPYSEDNPPNATPEAYVRGTARRSAT